MSAVLFHIASAADWGARTATYVSPSLETEGFIHCCTSSQLAAVADRKFRGRDNLLLLSIDSSRVRPEIRYENLEGGQEQFPHIYGPMNVDAVVAQRALRVTGDGRVLFEGEWPGDVQHSKR